MRKDYDDDHSTKTDKYSSLISTYVIKVLAILLLIGGLVSIAIPIVTWIKSPNYQILALGASFFVYGFACIILSAILYIVCNIADDIHMMSYNLSQKINGDNGFQRYVVDQMYRTDADLEKLKEEVKTISNRMHDDLSKTGHNSYERTEKA